MRKMILLTVVMVLAGMVAAAASARDVKLSGYIVDNACGTGKAGDAAGVEKIKNHPTKCALMPSCEKSGYAVFSDGKLYKLDKAGNEKAEALLKSTKSEKGLPVTVEGSIDGDTLHVTAMSEAAPN
jgi:hypothetical protein